MPLINSLLYIILWLYIHSPINLTNEFIDGLLITPNPDSYLSPPQIIKRHGYPIETYTILTPDGFILELHRIPNGLKKGEGKLPILLVHGYLDSSSAWIAQGPNQALAYLLADQGYDVWMINTRGNTFSRSHANYTPMEQKFWDFSFHEMGVYDLPTTIDFILNKTSHRQIFCICDSIGNAEFYIMLSVLPEYNEKIIAQVSLAPFYHQSPPIQIIILGPILDSVLKYLYWNTPGSLLEHDLLTKLVEQILISLSLFGYNGYDLVLYISYGLLPNHINWEIMPTVYNHFPAGTSVKASLQLLQFFYSFRYFDNGPEENLKIYGTTLPPEYNIRNIRIPVRIYHAEFDISASPIDVQLLYNKLPTKAGLITISDLGFSHVDFVWNKNAKKILYDDVITFVNDVLTQNTLSTT